MGQKGSGDMTGHESLRLVELAKDWLCCNGPVGNIMLRNDRRIDDGSTGIRFDGIRVYVGVKDFIDQQNKAFRDGVALVPFVGLFHEVAGHAMQLTREFDKTTTLSKVLFLSECACKGSAQYQGVDDNGVPHSMYFSHPHEIAAQYMGIKCGYEFLSCVLGDKQRANDMMMDYIVYRRELKCEFLPDNAECKDVDGVLASMNKEFQRRIEAQRPFEPEYDPDDALGMASDRRKNGNLLERVKTCKNGLRQDGMMASVFFENMRNKSLYETRFLSNTAVYKSVDLDVVKMFVNKGSPIWPPPRPISPNLRKLISVTDGIDAEAVRNDAKGIFEAGGP